MHASESKNSPGLHPTVLWELYSLLFFIEQVKGQQSIY